MQCTLLHPNASPHCLPPPFLTLSPPLTLHYLTLGLGEAVEMKSARKAITREKRRWENQNAKNCEAEDTATPAMRQAMLT